MSYRLFDHFGLDVDDILSFGSTDTVLERLGITGSIAGNIAGKIINELVTPRTIFEPRVPSRDFVQSVASELSNGFCAWFVLQHFRGYPPFITIMEKVEPLNFTI